MKARAWLLVLACLAPTAARADFHAKFNAGGWTDEHATGASELALPVSAQLDGRGAWSTTRVRYGFSVVGANHDYFQDRRVAVVREAFVALPLAGGELRLGRLLLTWGRADQINPTNSLVSRDYQWRTASDEEQSVGNDGLAWDREAGPWRVSLVWLPRMHSGRLPWIGALESVPNQSAKSRGNFGARLDYSGNRVDWGGSYYQGLDTVPTLALQVVPDVAARWENHRIRRAGLDAAVNLGKATVRGELAVTRVLERDLDAFRGQRANEVKAVLGMDRDIAPGLNLNLQVFGQWVSSDYFDDVPAALALQHLVNQQPRKNLYGATWRLRKAFLDDALVLEFSGIAFDHAQGTLLRPRVSYQLDDHHRLTLGGDRYSGGDAALLGLLEPNSSWFLEWRGAF